MKRCLILLLIGMLIISEKPAAAQSSTSAATRYLAFQVFTSGSPPPSPDVQPLLPPLSKAALRQIVQGIVDDIGNSGDSQHRLAFIIGPLAFDYSDAQLQRVVQDAFAVARELNIAVGFHIDDSMFWARRPDLWRDPRNVEWLNWEGTPNTGRRIDWGPQPTKLAPQMCFNSPAIQTEVNRLASQVIGKAIQQETARPDTPELFAGVIIGWETQLGQDFDTNQYLGYCALSNRGFSRTHPPQDIDAEREQAVQAFIELWASGIRQAGIDPGRIYSHTAFLPQVAFAALNKPGLTYSQFNHFALANHSPGANFEPGFSLYPQMGLMKEFYAMIQSQGNPRWALAEGSVVAPDTLESVVGTETYLGWMFNHNAILVNLFGWGVGSKGENPFWKAAASSEAINAYRKFLSGQPLIEAATEPASIAAAQLAEKIRKIQLSLPEWLPKHSEQQATIEGLLSQLDAAVKSGDYQAAVAAADAILRLIES